MPNSEPGGRPGLRGCAPYLALALLLHGAILAYPVAQAELRRNGPPTPLQVDWRAVPAAPAQQAATPRPAAEHPTGRRPTIPRVVVARANSPAGEPRPAQPTPPAAPPESPRPQATNEQPLVVTRQPDHPPDLPTDSPAIALSDIRPVYPARARQRGEQGRVLLRLQISPRGEVIAVDVLESSFFPSLDIAAHAAARQIRFQPAVRDGKAVASTLDLPIRFRLDGR